MLKKIRGRLSDQFAPLLFLCICAACFGILAPTLGFYWDDWAKTLVNVLYGMQGYWDYYASDRPYSGWTHILLVTLFGNGRVTWQLINLALRWAGVTAMWWSLTRLWPRARFEISLAAALFAVYPVFTQQAAAVTFHQQIMQYALYFVSMGLMIEALRHPRRYWLFTIFSLLVQAVQLTVTEYFVGVELLRPFFIWFLLAEKEPQLLPRFKKTLRAYIPYFLFIAAYVYWRMFLFKLPNADPHQITMLQSLLQNPVAALPQWFETVLVDSMYVILGSWAPAVGMGISADIVPSGWFSWAVGALLAGLMGAYYYLTHSKALDGPDQNRWILQAIPLGLMTVLLGCMPAWVTGRSVLDDYHANRFALPAMFGAALLLVALIIWLARTRWQAVLLTALLVGISGSYQVRMLNEYRWLWSDQQDFFWQLYWRAPHLEPGTALLFQKEPFPNQGLFSTSSAANLLYPQPEGWEKMAYWVYTLEPRYLGKLPEEASPNLNSTFRSLSFSGKLNESIVLHNDPAYSNCWWVLDRRDQLHPYLPDILKDYIVVSDLSQIHVLIGEDRQPPADLFGEEPAHGWCYYFEKAELAYHVQDWEGLAELGRDALAAGYAPDQTASNVPREWLSFIEAFARTGDMETASALSEASFNRDPEYQPMLCSVWNHLTEDDLAGVKDAQAWSTLGCAETDPQHHS